MLDLSVSPQAFASLNKKFNAAVMLRSNMLPYWRELAKNFLPARYEWLAEEGKKSKSDYRGNNEILDSTQTKALRVLASGLMDGITSPSRPWFKLGLKGIKNGEGLTHAAKIWLDEVEEIMRQILAGSNFYNALATNYLDLVLFGTACNIIYEDFDSVIRCYVPAVGEYSLNVDDRGVVNCVYREFQMSPRQMKSRFGEDNLSRTVKDVLKKNPESNVTYTVRHVIEPNYDDEFKMPGKAKFREIYWEKANQDPERKILSKKLFKTFPATCPRWNVISNSVYATDCPGMDALPDVRQLQHETMRKGQGLDKMVSPPLVLDLALRNNPSSILPGGKTFVPSSSRVGAKALYEVRVPVAELTADLQSLKNSIRETFYNDLFQKITNLQTVRSAREIDAVEGEKLTQLGPMLERYENEQLDPSLQRVFEIGMAKDLFPEPPEELADQEIEISYISILALAQSSVATAPTEQFIAMLGQVAGLQPEVTSILNWDSTLRNYAKNLGVRAADLNEPDVSKEINDQQAQAAQEQEQLAQASQAIEGAKLLSETDVGGGANALQSLL